MAQIPSLLELQQAVINKIEKRTGKGITLEECKKLDSVTIGMLSGINKISVKIGRRGPYKIVSLEPRRLKRKRLKENQ